MFLPHEPEADIRKGRGVEAISGPVEENTIRLTIWKYMKTVSIGEAFKDLGMRKNMHEMRPSLLQGLEIS